MKTQKIKFIVLIFFSFLISGTTFSQVRVNVNVGRPYYRPFRPYCRPVPPPVYYGGHVYVAPRRVYVAPRPVQRVWVPGYWTYNRRGQRIWINGFWRVF